MTVFSGTKVPSFGICAESHRKTLVVIQNRGPRRKFGRSVLRALSISILHPSLRLKAEPCADGSDGKVSAWWRRC
jgi:hypothetical protein